MSEIKQVTIVGSGLMGHGIGQEFALAGYQVILHDLTEEKLIKAVKNVRKNLSILQGFGLVDSEDLERTLSKIKVETRLEEAVEEADLVVEAMSEDLLRKQEIFKQLDKFCPRKTILATNSSSFIPSKIAVVTKRPELVVGTHYFNPPYLLPLVEIIRSNETSDETVNTIFKLLVKIGKSPIIVEKEIPGFVANRLQASLLREALSLIENGVATPQDVDKAIRTSIGRRWSVAGIFEITEIAGWDLKLAIVNELFPSLESSKEVPSILKEKVSKGELGIKTGKGFYEWNSETADALREKIAQALISISSW